MAETMVLIGCKAPNGLVLNLDSYKRRGDGGQVDRINGKFTVTLRGWSRPMNKPDDTEGGYALTPVPEDFWRAWHAAHKDSSLLHDRIILPPATDAVAQAIDHKAVPQMFRRVTPADVPGVQADKAA